MKICFIYSSIFDLGGVQRCITILSNRLIEKGYDVSVICTNTKEQVDRERYGLDRNVKIIFCEESTLRKILFLWRKFFIKINDKYGIFKNNLKFLQLIYYPHYRKIKNIIEKEQFDIAIGCATYISALLSIFPKFEKTKRIGWQHNSYENDFENIGRGFYNKNAIINEMLSNLDEYVVLTNSDREKIKKKFGFNVKTIYNAISFKQEKKSNLKNKKFLAIGRLAKEKRFDILIQNFKEFNKNNKEWKLDIVGEGPEKEELLNLIKELELEEYVTILPRTNNVAQLYKEASIYCMTSSTERVSNDLFRSYGKWTTNNFI